MDIIALLYVVQVDTLILLIVYARVVVYLTPSSSITTVVLNTVQLVILQMHLEIVLFLLPVIMTPMVIILQQNVCLTVLQHHMPTLFLVIVLRYVPMAVMETTLLVLVLV